VKEEVVDLGFTDSPAENIMELIKLRRSKSRIQNQSRKGRIRVGFIFVPKGGNGSGSKGLR